MKKIRIWYAIENCEDGSAYPRWFLTEAEAEDHQENQYEPWGESCIGEVDTYEGADIHLEALIASGKTTLDIGTGTPVPVVRDVDDRDNAISLSLFSDGVRAWNVELRNLGWDGESPVTWSFEQRPVETY